MGFPIGQGLGWHFWVGPNWPIWPGLLAPFWTNNLVGPHSRLGLWDFGPFGF